jgi:hypothetical protein
MNLPIDDGGETVAGKTFVRDRGLARFLIPGRPGSADARIEGDHIVLAPLRSSAHRALCAHLGVTPD